MTRKYRLALIVLSLLVLLAIGRGLTGGFGFIMNNFWFTSGLLLLVLLSLIDQPHFSKDSNIFVNAIVAAISLLLIHEKNRDILFWFFFTTSIYLMVCSYILLWVRQKPLAEESRYVRFFSRLNREVGKPEALFSAFFIWGAIKQFGIGTHRCPTVERINPYKGLQINDMRRFFSVTDLKSPAIFDHFTIIRQGMIDVYRKNRFCSAS